MELSHADRPGRLARRRRVRPLLAAAGLAAVTMIAACAAPPTALLGSVPQAVVNVPGSYTFTTLTELGVVYGKIYLCADAPTIVKVQADHAFFGVHPGSVTWNGAVVPTYSFPGSGVPNTVAAFGPVDPGCGEFANGVFVDGPIPVPNPLPLSITFSFTRCDPNSSLQDCATGP